MWLFIRIMNLITLIILIIVDMPSHAQTDNEAFNYLPQVLSLLQTDNRPPNLCEGFQVNDTSNRPMTAFAKPAPMSTYTDSVFGSKITRISNADVINSGVIRTLYSTIQSWNADESRLILWHRGDGHYLYNGKTYNQIERLNITPSDIEEIFWSTITPNIHLPKPSSWLLYNY